jgi:prophage maintenance system killer protein
MPIKYQIQGRQRRAPPPRKAHQNIPRFPRNNAQRAHPLERIFDLPAPDPPANAVANAAPAPVNAAPVQQPVAAVVAQNVAAAAPGNRQNDFKVGASPVFSLLGAPATSSGSARASPAARVPVGFLSLNPRSLPIAKPLTREEILNFQNEAGMPREGLRDRSSGFVPGEVTLGANLQSHASAGAGSYGGYRTEAARLAFNILTQQSFQDGNHRTALRAMYEYLIKNGLRMGRSPVMMYGKLHAIREETQLSAGSDAQYKKSLSKYINNIKPFKSQQEADEYAKEIRSSIGALPDKLKEVAGAKIGDSDKSSAEGREFGAMVKAYRKLMPQQSPKVYGKDATGNPKWTQAQRDEWKRRKRDGNDKKDDDPSKDKKK